MSSLNLSQDELYEYLESVYPGYGGYAEVFTKCGVHKLSSLANMTRVKMLQGKGVKETDLPMDVELDTIKYQAAADNGKEGLFRTLHMVDATGKDVVTPRQVQFIREWETGPFIKRFPKYKILGYAVTLPDADASEVEFTDIGTAKSIRMKVGWELWLKLEKKKSGLARIFAGFCPCFTAQDTTGGLGQDKTAAGAEVQRNDTTGGVGQDKTAAGAEVQCNDTTGGVGQDKTAAGAEVQCNDTTGGGKKHNKEGEDIGVKDQKDASS